MDILLLCLAVLALWGIKKQEDLKIRFDKSQTAGINGIFVVFIFIRHFFQYVEVGKFDGGLYILNVWSGQLIVVSFLFFSGYAFVKQYELKAVRYLNKMPSKILSLYLIFVLTVIAFLITGLCMHEKYDVKTVLFALIGMKSVGNSTWYIVAIIFMWLFSWIAFRQKRIHPLIVLYALVFCYVIVMHLLKKGIFYNTVSAYCLGVLFAFYEEKVCTTLEKHYPLWLVGILLLVTACAFYSSNIIVHQVWVLVFCVFLVLLSMKVQIGNYGTEILNQYSLEIYLVQRIPMIILKDRIHINLVYFLVCAAITAVIAVCWKRLFALVSRVVSNNMST